MTDNAKIDKLPSKKGKTRHILIAGIAALVLLGSGVGAFLWHQSASSYISTDNAMVEAALVPVNSLNTGRLIRLDVDIGSFVHVNERIAVLETPSVQNPSGVYYFGGYSTHIAEISSPVTGFIAAVWTEQGAVLSTGQQIVTIYDPSSVWITARVKEDRIWRVQPGQNVEITVDSLGGGKLQGTVQGIAAATAATFSLLPQQNTTGNFTRVTQVVPVKISIDQVDTAKLIPGSSVTVKIYTR